MLSVKSTTATGLIPVVAFRAAVLILMLALVGLAGHNPSVGSVYARWQGAVYDFLLRLMPARTDSRVVVAAIDQRSLQALGPWPWPRDRFAALIERLRQSEPAAIGVDIMFIEPSSPRADAALARELRQPQVAAPVVLTLGGLIYDNPDNGNPNPFWPEATFRVDLAETLSANATGHITPLFDADNHIRRLYPVICLGECYRTLSLRMLEIGAGQPAEFRQGPWPGAGRVCVADFCLRLNPDLSLSIPYQYSSSFSRISVVDILRGEAPLTGLDQSFVLIGTSAGELGDLVKTPLSDGTPGVDIHATVLAAALDSFSWSILPRERAVVTALIVSISALLIFWPTSSTRYKVITLGWLTLILLFSLLLPLSGYWANPLPLWGALIVAILSIICWPVVERCRLKRQ